MAKRPARPAGMSWLSPYISVKDCDRALDFYQRAFGFEKKAAFPGPDGKTMHAEVVCRDVVVMFGREDGQNCQAKSPATSGVKAPFGLYVYCDDVDALFARATKAGATATQAPENMFYGDRVCTVTDPDGYQWSFATNVADFDPEKMPK